MYTAYSCSFILRTMYITYKICGWGRHHMSDNSGKGMFIRSFNLPSESLFFLAFFMFIYFFFFNFFSSDSFFVSREFKTMFSLCYWPVKVMVPVDPLLDNSRTYRLIASVYKMLVIATPLKQSNIEIWNFYQCL